MTLAREEVRDEYGDVIGSRARARVCALNDCDHSIAHRSARTRFCSEKHRQAHYRAKVKAAAQAAGLPTHLSLQTVQTPTRTGKRSGDATAARVPRQPSLRVSYRKALDTLEHEFISLGFEAPRHKARAILRSLLTDKQRDHAREIGL